MPFAPEPSDRQAAHAARGGIDWTDVLLLELTEAGADAHPSIVPPAISLTGRFFPFDSIFQTVTPAPYYFGGVSLGLFPLICSSNRLRASPIS